MDSDCRERRAFEANGEWVAELERVRPRVAELTREREVAGERRRRHELSVVLGVANGI